MRLRRTIAGGVVLLVLGGTLAVLAGQAVGANEAKPAASEIDVPVVPVAPVEPSGRPMPNDAGTPVLVPSFDKAAHSLDDPNSIWLVVNKLRPLNPVDFVPGDLVELPGGQMRAEAAAAFTTMVDGAAAQGISIIAASAYRSYREQTWIYHGDDELTARPGYSEHQTGLTVDIATPSGECRIYQCFGDMAEGIWLRDNAWQYGFLLRYPADKTAVTGYDFEPWHFRYIGVELATEMHNRGIATLEEFFGLPAAPVYP